MTFIEVYPGWKAARNHQPQGKSYSRVLYNSADCSDIITLDTESKNIANAEKKYLYAVYGTILHL